MSRLLSWWCLRSSCLAIIHLSASRLIVYPRLTFRWRQTNNLSNSSFLSSRLRGFTKCTALLCFEASYQVGDALCNSNKTQQKRRKKYIWISKLKNELEM